MVVIEGQRGWNFGLVIADDYRTGMPSSLGGGEGGVGGWYPAHFTESQTGRISAGNATGPTVCAEPVNSPRKPHKPLPMPLAKMPDRAVDDI